MPAQIGDKRPGAAGVTTTARRGGVMTTAWAKLVATRPGYIFPVMPPSTR